MVNPINPNRIFDAGDSSFPSEIQKAKSDKATNSPDSHGVAKRGDQVTLSALAQEIQIVKNHLDDVPPGGVDQLKAIAERVAAGTYSVDAAAIADKIIHGPTEK